ncbi:MAG: TetR/AcrR family transcriptional regulator [Actinocatenispora sp.]
MNGERVSLRERRKRETRQEISDTATSLFLERGFDAVTIAQVAEAAGVAKMTVTNHFARKEDLVLDLHEELIAGPTRVVTDRGPGESPLAALRAWFLAAVERRDPAAGFCGQAFARMLVASPALVARMREIHDGREASLADALAAESRAAARDVIPRVVAAQLSGIHRVLFTEVFHRVLTGDPADQIAVSLADVTRAAFDQLTPSLGDYGVRPAGYVLTGDV